MKVEAEAAVDFVTLREDVAGFEILQLSVTSQPEGRKLEEDEAGYQCWRSDR
jgi:hypothetical protein